jgi:hypothetical protein
MLTQFSLSIRHYQHYQPISRLSSAHTQRARRRSRARFADGVAGILVKCFDILDQSATLVNFIGVFSCSSPTISFEGLEILRTRPLCGLAIDGFADLADYF